MSSLLLPSLDLIRSGICTHPVLLSFIQAHSPLIRPHNTFKAPPQTLTPAASHQILVSQRLRRPLAPHLAIYKWQITSVLSSLERIAGVILAGSVYIFGLTYVASPLLGWNMSSASIAAAFGAWPVIAKVATKFFVAFPFTLHAFNGVRYLIWDLGKQMGKRQVIKTGWLAVGAATLSAGWLAFL
jgi:succinate dehydrogenase (ubiquinone) cytochrome b560 subunit